MITFNQRAGTLDHQQKMKEGLAELVNAQKQFAEKQTQALEDKILVSEYQFLSKEISATFETASMIASLAGKPKDAKNIGQVGKMASVAFKLYTSSNSKENSALKLGTMVATQNYVALAGMAIGMLSGNQGGGFETAVMEQMAAIIEMIQDLSKKIDTEFAIVNQKLDNMDSKLSQIVAEIRAGTEITNTLIFDLSKSVQSIEKILENAAIKKKMEDGTNVERYCIQDSDNYNDLKSSGDFIERCLKPINNASADFITIDYLSINPGSIKDLAPFSIGQNRRDLLPLLVKELARKEVAAHPFYANDYYKELILPDLWLNNSSRFLDLVDLYPHHHKEFMKSDFDAIIKVGEKYVAAVQNLLVMGGSSIRMGVANSLLKIYKEKVENLISYAKGDHSNYEGTAGVPQLGVENRYGFNSSLTITQPVKDVKWANGEVFKQCGTPPFKLLRLIEVDQTQPSNKVTEFSAKERSAFINGYHSYHRDNGRLGLMRLPKDFAEYLPNEIRWLVKMEPKSINFCLDTITLNKLEAHFHVQHPLFGGIAQKAYNRINYQATIRVKINYHKKQLAEVNFPINGEYDSKVRRADPRFAFMHSVGVTEQNMRTDGGMSFHATFMRSPNHSKATIAKEFSQRQWIIDHFEETYSKGKNWDQEAYNHFMKRNSKFIEGARETRAMADILFIMADLGLNDAIPLKDEILNSFLSTNGIIDASQYLKWVIFNNWTLKQVSNDLDNRIARVSSLLTQFEQQGKDLGMPLHQSVTTMESQIKLVNHYRDNVLTQ